MSDRRALPQAAPVERQDRTGNPARAHAGAGAKASGQHPRSGPGGSPGHRPDDPLRGRAARSEGDYVTATVTSHKLNQTAYHAAWHIADCLQEDWWTVEAPAGALVERKTLTASEAAAVVQHAGAEMVAGRDDNGRKAER